MRYDANIERQSAKYFVDRGFRRARHGILLHDLDSATCAWVGLNRARYREGTDISPLIGVRNQLVERVVLECCGIPDDGVSPPTIAANVGYLLPSREFKSFLFDGSDADGDRLLEMCAEVFVAVEAYAQAHSSLEGLANSLVSFPTQPRDNVARRLPVIWHMLGESAKAETVMCAELERAAALGGEGADEYSGFCARVRARFQSKSE